MTPTSRFVEGSSWVFIHYEEWFFTPYSRQKRGFKDPITEDLDPVEYGQLIDVVRDWVV